MRLPTGLRIDSPAWPLLQAHISYIGITTAAGSAFGTSLVDALCSTAGQQPSYHSLMVKLLDGPAAGQARLIQTHALATGTLTWVDPFTDYTGAVYQVPANIKFVIISAGGGGAAPAPVLAPSIGLWMFGECDPAMAGSTNTLVLTNLAGFPDDIFNDDFYIEIIRNDNNVGLAPEHEIQLVTDYVGATGAFTTNNFTANVEANDLVAVIHHSLIGPELNLISTLVKAIFDIVNAGLVTTETGGTILTDGTEQNVYINNAPSSVYEPLKVMIDFSIFVRGAENHGSQATETIVVRTYYRIYPGGSFIKKDQLTFAGIQDPELKNIELEPNRYGIQVTMQRTAGNARYYDWAAFYRG
jgi:hypothetical protein